jgi:hypothetical protein
MRLPIPPPRRYVLQAKQQPANCTRLAYFNRTARHIGLSRMSALLTRDHSLRVIRSKLNTPFVYSQQTVTVLHSRNGADFL